MYPDSVDKFNDKLNKIEGNTYVIEEKVDLVNGSYESELQHDNISVSSLNVYTGSKLTGNKVDTYTLSTPSASPWKKVIKIYSDTTPLYISYETTGDTVEADDINKVQDSITNTQITLNSEISRAKSAENTLTNNLNSEITRAQGAEADLSSSLNSEETRAKGAEGTLTTNLGTTNTNLNNEITRAKNEEATLSSNLSSETTRAQGAESTLTANLNLETARAKNAENGITNTISANKPIWDDKYTKNEIDNKISAVVTSLDYKEHVATFTDLATTYPDAKDGWTASVDADNYTYKFNGTSWIPISANSVPLASSSVSGLMSSQDKIDHDDMVAKRHTHNNLSLLQTITQVLVGNWNNAYTHISDAVKHITSTERTNWNDAYSKEHTHSNLNLIETFTQNLVNTWNSAYTHISDTVKHITSAERTLWNTVSNKSDVGHTHTKSNITDFPTSMSANGGNSDTVDGKHSSDFISRIMSSASLDFNTIKTSGIYSIKATNTNSPTPGNHGTLVVEFDVGTPYQLWIPDDLNTFYKRNYAPSSSTWGSWINVLGLDTLGADAKYATKSEISQAGYGDMLKSIYDTNNNGIVDKAEDSNTVGGKSSSSFATAAQGTKADNALPSSSYTASDILTKIKTVDGSASGLDADTVDGKNASDFAPSGYGLGGISARLSSPDLNNVINNGWYDCQTPTNYVPDIGSNWHKLLVIASADTNYVTQIAFSMVNQTSGSAWIREKRAGTWGNWTRILTSSKQCTWNDLKGV